MNRLQVLFETEEGRKKLEEFVIHHGCPEDLGFDDFTSTHTCSTNCQKCWREEMKEKVK